MTLLAFGTSDDKEDLHPNFLVSRDHIDTRCKLQKSTTTIIQGFVESLVVDTQMIHVGMLEITRLANPSLEGFDPQLRISWKLWMFLSVETMDPTNVRKNLVRLDRHCRRDVTDEFFRGESQ